MRRGARDRGQPCGECADAVLHASEKCDVDESPAQPADEPGKLDRAGLSQSVPTADVGLAYLYRRGAIRGAAVYQGIARGLLRLNFRRIPYTTTPANRAPERRATPRGWIPETVTARVMRAASSTLF